MKYHEKISDVYDRISPYVRQTPLLKSRFLSEQFNNLTLLKCENLQFTNAFKVRGAFNKVALIRDKNNKTLIASSGGNHGMAVAFAAKTFNLRALIIVPEFVPQFRIERIRALGADVIVYGQTMDDLNQKVAEYTKDPTYIEIHPFSDDDVIAGQATVAYEILQMMPDIDVIVASIGGGGLISGISQYAKSFNPHIKIYGVQTVGANAMYESLVADKLVSIPSISSIAVSLGATRVTEKTFEIVKKNVDKVVTVKDEEAILNLKQILDKEKLLAEPASSCTVSALFSGKIPDLEGKKVVAVLSGGNFSLDQLKSFL